jgi:hypothetical protein
MKTGRKYVEEPPSPPAVPQIVGKAHHLVISRTAAFFFLNGTAVEVNSG